MLRYLSISTIGNKICFRSNKEGRVAIDMEELLSGIPHGILTNRELLCTKIYQNILITFFRLGAEFGKTENVENLIFDSDVVVVDVKKVIEESRRN